MFTNERRQKPRTKSDSQLRSDFKRRLNKLSAINKRLVNENMQLKSAYEKSIETINQLLNEKRIENILDIKEQNGEEEI